MSKRRITKQQANRIKENQQGYQHEATDNAELHRGLVIKRFSKHALIENQSGQIIHCLVRPHIDSLVAGDQIVFQLESSNQGVVVSVYPRTRVLGRHNKQGQMKPVAANITQILVVIAAKPMVSWALLDSYLIMAEYSDVDTCIILNKVDLECSDIQDRLKQVYHPLGYPVIYTSQADHQGFIDKLNHQISVFVGQSGVGKSSLISKILPHESTIQINAISEVSELGRHTTSNSTFYHLPTGGAIIDSPGVRELSLGPLPFTEIAKGYREFQPFLGYCKFRDCKHWKVPGCAIIEGVLQGHISTFRYNTFIGLTILP